MAEQGYRIDKAKLIEIIDDMPDDGNAFLVVTYRGRPDEALRHPDLATGTKSGERITGLATQGNLLDLMAAVLEQVKKYPALTRALSLVCMATTITNAEQMAGNAPEPARSIIGQN